jgi:hypothetical protein
MGSCRPFNAACTPKAEKATDSGLLQSKFQTEVDGKKTDLFTLRNKKTWKFVSRTSVDVLFQ